MQFRATNPGSSGSADPPTLRLSDKVHLKHAEDKVKESYLIFKEAVRELARLKSCDPIQVEADYWPSDETLRAATKSDYQLFYSYYPNRSKEVISYLKHKYGGKLSQYVEYTSKAWKELKDAKEQSARYDGRTYEEWIRDSFQYVLEKQIQQGIIKEKDTAKDAKDVAAERIAALRSGHMQAAKSNLNAMAHRFDKVGVKVVGFCFQPARSRLIACGVSQGDTILFLQSLHQLLQYAPLRAEDLYGVDSSPAALQRRIEFYIAYLTSAFLQAATNPASSDVRPDLQPIFVGHLMSLRIPTTTSQEGEADPVGRKRPRTEPQVADVALAHHTSVSGFRAAIRLIPESPREWDTKLQGGDVEKLREHALEVQRMSGSHARHEAACLLKAMLRNYSVSQQSSNTYRDLSRFWLQNRRINWKTLFVDLAKEQTRFIYRKDEMTGSEEEDESEQEDNVENYRGQDGDSFPKEFPLWYAGDGGAIEVDGEDTDGGPDMEAVNGEFSTTATLNVDSSRRGKRKHVKTGETSGRLTGLENYSLWSKGQCKAICVAIADGFLTVQST